MLHWLVADNGRWYGFWSGFGSDLAYLGAAITVWRHLNCHAQGCWRFGRHPLTTPHGPVKVCHHHHPDRTSRSVAVELLHAENTATIAAPPATPSTPRRAPRAAHTEGRSPRAPQKPTRKEPS